MKKVILSAVAGAVLIVTVFVTWAVINETSDWQYLYSSAGKDTKNYINSSTIKVENAEDNIKSVWGKALNGDDSYLMFQIVINCSTQEFYNRSGAFFNSKGERVKSFDDGDEWIQATPNSNIMFAINRVCK